MGARRGGVHERQANADRAPGGLVVVDSRSTGVVFMRAKQRDCICALGVAIPSRLTVWFRSVCRRFDDAAGGHDGRADSLPNEGRKRDTTASTATSTTLRLTVVKPGRSSRSVDSRHRNRSMWGMWSHSVYNSGRIAIGAGLESMCVGVLESCGSDENRSCGKLGVSGARFVRSGVGFMCSGVTL